MAQDAGCADTWQAQQRVPVHIIQPPPGESDLFNLTNTLLSGIAILASAIVALYKKQMDLQEKLMVRNIILLTKLSEKVDMNMAVVYKVRNLLKAADPEWYNNQIKNTPIEHWKPLSETLNHEGDIIQKNFGDAKH